MSMKQIVKFFKNKLDELDKSSCNITFVNGHREEIIYDLTVWHNPEYMPIFYDVLATYFPDIDISRVDGISYQQADGGLYSEDKIMISLDGAQKDCFLYPEIGCFTPWQHYCINVGVETGKRSYKFYDLDNPAYEVFQWPEFMIPFTKYGTGVGIKPDIVGVYFLSKEYDKVIEHLGAVDPLPADIKQQILDKASIHNFGLTFNIKTMELVKLSYFFYNDQYRQDVLPFLKDDNGTAI